MSAHGTREAESMNNIPLCPVSYHGAEFGGAPGGAPSCLREDDLWRRRQTNLPGESAVRPLDAGNVHP